MDDVEIIKKMTDPDKDYRFMALIDLTARLQTVKHDDIVISDPLVKTALDRLIDVNLEVQTQAVKCVGELSKFATRNQADLILQKALEGFCSPTIDRPNSVWYMLLKSIVSSAPAGNEDLITALGANLVPTLVKVSSTSNNGSLKTEALDILSELISRFTPQLYAYHAKILDAILALLDASDMPMRNKAVQIVPRLVAFERGYERLLSFVRIHMDCILGKDGVNPTQFSATYLRITLQCLTALSRKAECLAADAPDLIVEDCLGGFLVGDSLETRVLSRVVAESGEKWARASLACDIREMALQALEAFIRARKASHKDAAYLSRLILMNFDNIVGVLSELLVYAPVAKETERVDNGSGAMDVNEEVSDEESDDDDDDDEDFTDDDDEDFEEMQLVEELIDRTATPARDRHSWKVRRAAASVVDAFMQTFPEKLGSFFAAFSPILVSRLTDEPIGIVRWEVFACLNDLLRASALKNPNSLPLKLKRSTPQTLLLRLLDLIFTNIGPYIGSLLGKRARCTLDCLKPDSETHRCAVGVIRGLALAIPGQLQPYMHVIVKLLEIDFKRTQTPSTVLVELLRLMEVIVNSHPYKAFADHLETLRQVVVKAVGSSQNRVSLSGMNFLQALLKRIPLDANMSMATVFPAVCGQLEVERGLDHLEKTLATAGLFIEYVGQDIPAEAIKKCINRCVALMDSDRTRVPAIHCLSSIFKGPLSFTECPASVELMSRLRNIVEKRGEDNATTGSGRLTFGRGTTASMAVAAALHALTVLCHQHPRDFLLNSGPSNTTHLLEALPSLLGGSSAPGFVGEALELAAVLLKCTSQCDVAQQVQVADFYVSEAFMGPLVALANSNLTASNQLQGMVNLMQSCVMYRPQNHKLSAQFLLKYLQRPLKALRSTELDAAFVKLKETLPTLARTCAEVIISLPRYGQVNSSDAVLETMVGELRNPALPYVLRYLYLLIFGDVGYHTDISVRGDLFDILVDHIVLNDNILPPNVASMLKSPLEASPTIFPSASGDTNDSRPQPYDRPLAASIPSSTSSSSLGGFGDLRPLAAAQLARVIAGAPAATVHELLAFFEQSYTRSLATYYLFYTFRLTLISLVEVRATEHIYPHLEKVWSILMANADHAEEGTRTLVAECLGRVVLLYPDDLVPRLHADMTSEAAKASAPLRCTCVTAFKYLLAAAVTINYPDDDNDNVKASISSSLTPIASSLLTLTTLKDREELVGVLLERNHLADVLRLHLCDRDPDVSRAALVTFNTAAHYWPPLTRSLLAEKEEIVAMVYADTQVREDLVRTVVMGPFTIKFDDGIELRKTAYECLTTLLESYSEALDMAAFLDTLIGGLRDVNHIKLTASHILRRVIPLAPISVLAKMSDVASAVTAMLLLQPASDPARQESEKCSEVKEAAVRVVADLANCIANIQSDTNYANLLRVIRSDRQLNELWKSVLKEAPA